MREKVEDISVKTKKNFKVLFYELGKDFEG